MPGAIHYHESLLPNSLATSCQCNTIAVPSKLLQIVLALADTMQETYEGEIDIHCVIQHHASLLFKIVMDQKLLECWKLDFTNVSYKDLELNAIQAQIHVYRAKIPNRPLSVKSIRIHQEICESYLEFGHDVLTVKTPSTPHGSFSLTVERLDNVTRPVRLISEFPVKTNHFQERATKPQNVPRVVARRRLSCLSLSAIHDEDSPNNHEDHFRTTVTGNKQLQYTIANHRSSALSSSPPEAIDIPSTRMVRRKSTVEHFVGSFEENLMNNRMSTTPAATIQFHATICAVARGSVKKRENFRPSGPQSVDFEAHMYEWDGKPLPYAGTIDLGFMHSQYRIPPKGQLQVMITQGDRGMVKAFIVSYDLRDMPANHSTFVRRQEYVTTRESGMKTLKYAIHIPIKTSKHRQLYLHGPIRVVFCNYANNADDHVEVKMEYPSVSCKYLPIENATSSSI
ncbi:hypothetical protein BC943DRAFT_317853 [Umbelopsis sp. AD052]|nr:hypothetical protein BC943DRAFT_317853 [Umbelopsis sp. AD052]